MALLRRREFQPADADLAFGALDHLAVAGEDVIFAHSAVEDVDVVELRLGAGPVGAVVDYRVSALVGIEAANRLRSDIKDKLQEG